MRLGLPTDLISRDGTVDQDGKMLNCFMEDGNAIKRPAVASNVVDVAGTAQGGISNNSLVYIINGDVMRSYNSSYVLQQTVNL